MKSNGQQINPVFQVQDLKAGYHKKEVLSGISLSIAKGEIVALTGINGSGKSTFLKAVAGLVPPQSGSIIYDGMDISAKSPKDLVGLGIGLLMQGGAVFPSLTIEEHLQLASGSRGAIPEEMVESVHTMFPFLKKDWTVRAGLLSGGKRQMLAISMLLIRPSSLWLLDEPSGGLAPNAVRDVMTAVKSMSGKKNITVLLAEQNLEESFKIANRVYLLQSGKTYYEGTPEEIRTNGKLEEAFFGQHPTR